VRPALDAAEAETAGGGRTGRRRRNVHRRLQGRCSVGSPISYMPHTGGAASGRVGRGRVADEDLRRGRAPAADQRGEAADVGAELQERHQDEAELEGKRRSRRCRIWTQLRERRPDGGDQAASGGSSPRVAKVTSAPAYPSRD
jgi:hypothetical protein